MLNISNIDDTIDYGTTTGEKVKGEDRENRGYGIVCRIKARRGERVKIGGVLKQGQQRVEGRGGLIKQKKIGSRKQEVS